MVKQRRVAQARAACSAAEILQTETGSARAIAKRLDDECSPDDRMAWQSGTPADWANESLAFTIEYVYPLPESHEISAAYAQRPLPILHKRLEQAGVRLAWLLNEAMKYIPWGRMAQTV